MKTCRRLLVLQLLLVPRLISAAQVTLSASTPAATIAEHVELRLIVRSLENIDETKVSVPAGDFEIIRRQSLPRIKTAEWCTFEHVFTIAFFKTGDFVIGPMEVELLAAKTVREKEPSGTVAIKIRSLLGENDTDIRPLKKLLPIAGNPLHLLKYLAVGLVLLLSAFLLVLKRNRGKTGPVVAAALPDPEIELETHIRELWRKDLPQKGEFKLFFIALGEIIKCFLARTYAFNADDLTSTEVIARLRSSEKNSAVIAGMEDIFRQADLVKFAKQVPEASTIASLADTIAALIGMYKKKRRLENEAPHVQTGS